MARGTEERPAAIVWRATLRAWRGRADGSQSGQRLARRRRMAIRTEVGQLSLHRLQGRPARSNCSRGPASRCRATSPRSSRIWARWAVDIFVLDGELMVPNGDAFSFDALGQRIHPAASRIAKLSAETPALLAAFDMLVSPQGEDLRGAPLVERRRRLVSFCADHADDRGLTLGPATADRATAERWLRDAGATYDGVIAKRLDEPNRAGERAMVKVKHKRTVDCVVGGFRYASGKREVGSLLLGLYDGERLHHVGFTSNLPKADRDALTAPARGARRRCRLRRERAGKAQPLGLGAERRMDAARARTRRRGGPTTRSPAAACAMVRASCAGVRTSRRGNAPSRRSSIDPSRHSPATIAARPLF